MDISNPNWKHKLGVLLLSFFLIGLLLLGGELYCRFFTNINFLDNSRGMFQPNKYSFSYGNTPNFEGISFGEKFNTDENGFRFDRDYRETAPPGAPAILIIGDSMTFGPAVEESSTIAGIIRRGAPENKVYNASSIGFDSYDYKNVIDSVIPQKPQIKKVLLFFCFNDVNNQSAQQIREQTKASANEAPPDESIIRKLNDFLRSRSKLYLLIKNTLRDTQMIYFQNDLGQYTKGDDYVAKAMQPLQDIKATLDKSGISLEVFVLPYEAQLRPGAPEEYFKPQQMIDANLQKNNIPFRDLTPEFQKSPAPKELFLYGDPMHLSAKGNQLVGRLACEEIKDVCR